MSADLPVAAFDAMWSMAHDPSKRTALVQDEACMGGLVLVLSNKDQTIVKKALEILQTLAQCSEHRHLMKNFLGLVDQLESLFTHTSIVIQGIAKDVHSMIHSGPLRDTANMNKLPFDAPSKSELFRSCSTVGPRKEANVNSRRRRNSFFIGSGISKSKVIILQLRGLNDRDDVDMCRACLLTVKGVISITVDFNRKRATLRTKPDLKPELLARAIARTMTMAAQQVIKDEDGIERLLSFGSNAAALNKENEAMPDYPDDENNPILGDENMARMGGAPKKESWNFAKSFGNFLSNSFYW